MPASDLSDIRNTLIQILKAHTPPLQVRVDTDAVFEVAGTKPTMQGKQKVDGIYFASVVPKPGDIRLYFFPNYTHPAAFSGMSDALKKCLKGKSCFHIKKLDPALEAEIKNMVATGVAAYQTDGLI
ncbi:MAG: hypothetical protein KDC61_07700 [Saprospiraceae bacterium]|nr:hypothetical protein [Saprospiraceae bacterium]MCB0544436.1 hypothetical protein [Saprospiraceae bacterium]MCB0574434.1 hypothetical protein [Saprospiraceae bacterium]MCB9356835.1 hypothetical protein [Lewinellaceae bacterium]